MEPKEKKNKKPCKENIDIEMERKEENISSEDIDMLRERDNHMTYSQYDDDNSFGDDR